MAIAAFNRRQDIHFMTTLCLINAIITVGNGIISAISGGGSGQNSDNFSKSLEQFRELMFPEDEEKSAERDKKFMEKMKEELSRGPIKVRPKATTSRSKDKGRIRRKRRSDIDGPEPQQ